MVDGDALGGRVRKERGHGDDVCVEFEGMKTLHTLLGLWVCSGRSCGVRRELGQ